MLTDRAKFSDDVSKAVSRLFSAELYGETVTVSLPVSYPSGAFAGVNVSLSGGLCFVSDSAIGLREAEMACAADFYDSCAKQAASWFGCAYDGVSVFAASAPIDRIEGAISAVANASVQAVSNAMLKAGDAKDRISNLQVYEIVAGIFGHQNVTRKMEIAGRDATWEANNVVKARGEITIFEFVSDHSNSIASKFLMFSDLVRREDPPHLVSLVKSIEKLGPKGSMLGDVSNVIQLDAKREVFLRYSNAA
jgi:hypothetical protein